MHERIMNTCIYLEYPIIPNQAESQIGILLQPPNKRNNKRPTVFTNACHKSALNVSHTLAPHILDILI